MRVLEKDDGGAKSSNAFNFCLRLFTTLSIAIIAVFLGFDLMNGKIALFPALGILILAPDYFLPIRDFAGISMQP